MRRTLPAVIGVLLAACLFTAGCDNSIPGVDVNDEETYFSLYGYLLTGTDTMRVRVIPLRDTLVRPEPRQLDAEVTSTDLETGKTVQWRDTLVRYPDGNYSHVFKAMMTVKPEHTYRIEVRRSDGKITRAVVQVPERPTNFRVGEPFVRLGYKQTITWSSPLQDVFLADVTYVVQTREPVSEVTRVTVPYHEVAERTREDWSITIVLNNDFNTVYAALADGIEFTINTEIILHEVQLYVAMPHNDWAPPEGYGYDPFVLSQPGVFSNVENGFGFVGGAADTMVAWELSEEARRHLGYATDP